MQFISKCGIKYPPEGSTHAVKHYDYSAAHIRQSVENSLRNLRTAHIDVYLLHRPSPLLDAQEAFATLETLREEGKINAWGVSSVPSVRGAVWAKEHSIWFHAGVCCVAISCSCEGVKLDTPHALILPSSRKVSNCLLYTSPSPRDRG